MGGANIIYHGVEDVDNILQLVSDIAHGRLKRDDVEFITNMYFAGRTLCVDMYSQGVKDVMTFCHADESVGFFSGGYRRLLSIKSMRIFEQLMVDGGIKHDTKWIEA